MQRTQIPIFQIDAFTDRLFGGNPAAVCPLQSWLGDDILLEIAKENNLAETAYFTHISANRYHLRWFTPEIEMDLCGHATLATAYVIYEELGFKGEEIIFETLSGLLTVSKEGELFVLDFPSRPPVKAVLPEIIREGLGKQPLEVWKARDYLLLFESEEDVRNIQPNLAIINQINIDPGGIIVTAPGDSDNVDFVSRFFTPQASIFEDPVTGSAHCILTPFWSERLHKRKHTAHQVSSRGGIIQCELHEERVKLKGSAVKYLEGSIYIPS